MSADQTVLDENLEYHLITSDLIPDEWKQTIGRDMQKQREQTITRPLSDAYYNGLPKRFGDKKRQCLTKTYSLKEYAVKAIKCSTNTSLDDNDIDSICGQTSDLQIEFDECLKKLLNEHISSKYEGFDLNKFNHLNEYLFK